MILTEARWVWWGLGSLATSLDQRPGLTVVVNLGLRGRDRADLAVEAAVVPPIDVLGDRELELLDCPPRPVPVDQFGLQLPDRGLGEGVVVGVADAADRGDRAGRGEPLGVADREILTAGVGVGNEPVEPVLLSSRDGQLECLQRQL